MDVLTFLQQHPDARKIFGKRELVIIRKQLLGLRLTQSERNRLSRDIRRKLTFVDALARFRDEFGLSHGAQLKRTLNEAKEAILEDSAGPRVNRIVLFGSVLSGDLTLTSDIDLAIDVPGISLRDATALRRRLLGKLPEHVDVQVYSTLPAHLKSAVDKGKVLFGR